MCVISTLHPGSIRLYCEYTIFWIYNILCTLNWTRLKFFIYLSFHESFSSCAILVDELLHSPAVELPALVQFKKPVFQTCHTKAAIIYGGVHLLIICELRKCTCNSNDWKFSILVAVAIPTYFQVGYLSILSTIHHMTPSLSRIISIMLSNLHSIECVSH